MKKLEQFWDGLGERKKGAVLTLLAFVVILCIGATAIRKFTAIKVNTITELTANNGTDVEGVHFENDIVSSASWQGSTVAVAYGGTGTDTVLAQVVTVGKAGAQYTTVQGAINAITDESAIKRYIVEIAPGRYNEQITAAAWISLKGLGVLGDVEIYYDGDVLDCGSEAVTSYENIHFKSTATTTNKEAVKGSAGLHSFFGCTLEWTSSTNAIKGRVADINGGAFLFYECLINYTQTSSTSASANHIGLDIDGDSTILLQGCAVNVTVDCDDNVYAIDDNSTTGGEFFVKDTRVELDVGHATFSSSAMGFRQRASTHTRRIVNCHIHLLNTGGGAGGTGTALWLDSGGNTGFLHSLSNDIIVQDFANNYCCDADVTDTLSSHFDDIEAVDGTNGAGIFIKVNSPADGDLSVSNEIETDTINEYTSGAGVTVDDVHVNSGWIDFTGTVPTRTDADTVIYELTFSEAVDVDTGARVRIYQNGTPTYFLLHKTNYPTNPTVWAVYSGSDTSDSVGDTGVKVIESIDYSRIKSPLGFPQDPDHWTQSLSDVAASETPTINWKLESDLTFDMPVGTWKFTAKCDLGIYDGNSAVEKVDIAMCIDDASITGGTTAPQYNQLFTLLTYESEHATANQQHFSQVFFEKYIYVSTATQFFTYVRSPSSDNYDAVYVNLAEYRAISAYY